jgi:orotate phosphoribosyltransferase
MRRAESIEWVSVEQLQSDTLGLLNHLPPDIDAVAGVPRSGMIPATTLAAMLHLPLFQVTAAGLREVVSLGRLKDVARPQRPLIVDDSVFTGVQMEKVRTIMRASTGMRPVYAAVYCTHRLSGTLDLVGRKIDPHLFAWNLFNSSLVSAMAFDFDGVLCADPPDYLDCDDGRAAEWFAKAPPLYPARMVEVPAIITGRLERHRAVTEAWLAKWGVRCQRLIMSPHTSHLERNERVAAWKAAEYAKLPQEFYVESDPRQSLKIYRASGKKVICPTAGIVWQELPWSRIGAAERAKWRERRKKWE